MAGSTRRVATAFDCVSVLVNVWTACRRYGPDTPGRIAALVLAGSLFGSALHAADLPLLRSDRVPQFTADLVVSLRPDGEPALAVSIVVPYRQLEWLKAPLGYAAVVEFTVVFEPDHPGAQIGDSWDRPLLVADFSTTVKAGSSVIERRTFDLPPGRYRVRIGVRAGDSDVPSTATGHVEVPDYSRVPLGLADVELGVAGLSGEFQPVPSRAFGRNASRLAARMALFDRRAGAWPRDYPVRYWINDDTGNEVATGTRSLSLSHSNEPVVVAPDSLDLFLGSYVFVAEIGQGDSRWRVERSFEVEDSGPPRGREFQRLLEPLSFIADGHEIDRLRKLAPADQAAGWEAFWQRRDPTPDTPRNEALLEFFRRVRYASRHFQTFGPGWRSDMGRIYIKYGPPDQTESRPATGSDAPLEIWDYNRPYRRFVFEDRDGFGRYVLVGPVTE